jgi:transcriptional regulator with XRE-family HTH domain
VRIAAERQQRGWTTDALAERSGVSRAMISKIERGLAHPTASLLGKLSAAFALPMSHLFASIEGGPVRLAEASTQSVWRDPSTKYVRRSISSPSDSLLQLTKIDLPPGAKVVFPAAAYTFIHQQVWILRGTLLLREGAVAHQLKAGDCLTLGTPADCTFHNRSAKACQYLVAVVRR